MRSAWVVLTTGGRPAELESALASIRRVQPGATIVVVANGLRECDLELSDPDIQVVVSVVNLGVPGGRDVGVSAVDADVVFFLDDDAVVRSRDIASSSIAAFEADERLGAISFRLIDEGGATARRHVPRVGGRTAATSGLVATFLGGACAIRRQAYDDVGGYWTALHYGHEELELSWRLVDSGWSIRYASDLVVFHPRTLIARHPSGWYLTGRNRVLIARRDLPWLVAVVHVAIWAVVGVVRSGGRSCRKAYMRGLRDGRRQSIDRRPISWRTVWTLTRLGRPPIV